MTLSDGWPPFYAERKTSAGVDVNQLYVAFVASALTFALLLILPGVRGLERSYFLLRWSVTLLVGALIIGLREKNINLNEQFTFLTVDDTIFDSLQRGLPFPILTVAEHFSSVRFHSLWPWGRKYWMAGHYASYLLWTALACWGLTNVLFHMALQHGSVFMILTGILLLCTNISFATVNAGEQLVITLGYKDPSDRLILAFGWCFWSCLFVGFSCVVLGTIAYILEKVNKSYLEKFFMLRDNQDKQEDDDIELDYNISKSSEPSTPIRGILKSSSSSGEVNPSFVMETIDESTSRKRSTVTISDSADEVFAGKDSKRFKFKKVEEVL
ncbi:dual oxidase maturation factor 1-like isoform X2 [Styela clava]